MPTTPGIHLAQYLDLVFPHLKSLVAYGGLLEQDVARSCQLWKN